MEEISKENVLIIIPNSQYCDEELYGVMSSLKESGVRAIVLSKSGQEAFNMKRDKFKLGGMIVVWGKQRCVNGKCNAVILVGGKGARKSLWDDSIITQVLADYYRAGRVIGRSTRQWSC